MAPTRGSEHNGNRNGWVGMFPRILRRHPLADKGPHPVQVCPPPHGAFVGKIPCLCAVAPTPEGPCTGDVSGMKPSIRICRWGFVSSFAKPNA